MTGKTASGSKEAQRDGGKKSLWQSRAGRGERSAWGVKANLFLKRNSHANESAKKISTKKKPRMTLETTLPCRNRTKKRRFKGERGRKIVGDKRKAGEGCYEGEGQTKCRRGKIATSLPPQGPHQPGRKGYRMTDEARPKVPRKCIGNNEGGGRLRKKALASEEEEEGK